MSPVPDGPGSLWRSLPIRLHLLNLYCTDLISGYLGDRIKGIEREQIDCRFLKVKGHEYNARRQIVCRPCLDEDLATAGTHLYRAITLRDTEASRIVRVHIEGALWVELVQAL